MTSLTRRTLVAAGFALPALRIPGARARTPGTLTFGLSSFPPSLAPWANAGTASGTVKLLIFRGLTSFAPDGKLQGELAESWTSEGNNTWVFKLRDAVFHNGEKVTSADVKWTIEQIADAKSTAFFKADMQGVERVETPDDRTVRIVTKQPNATLPITFGSFHLPIVWKGSSAATPVGCGPFVIKAQERGASIDLEPFAKFYKPGLPKLKAVRMVAYADENLRVAALQSGDVDLIEYVPWQAMGGIEANPALKLEAVDGPFMYLVFNGTKPPFNDKRVRKAVAHAIKRDEIVKAAFFGRGSALAHLPIAEASPFYNADLKDGWRHDPALAKKLLAEAGHASIQTTLLATAQYGMHKDTAEIVQQNLAEVGIQAELKLPDWATRVNLGNRGQFDLAIGGTAADSNDPDGLLSIVDGSLSPSYTRSYNLKIDGVSELFAKGRAEFDEGKRKAIYKELESLVIEEAPMVGLAWRSQGYAMRKEVRDFVNLPGALTFYSGLTFETAQVS